MRRILLVCAIAPVAAFANSSSCPTGNTTTISNATIQAAPAGCQQVDMLFNLTSTVISQFADLMNVSSLPSDSNVDVTGTGVAGGTGANAQGLIYSQTGGIVFKDTGSGNETIDYTWHFGVADQAANEVISAIDLTYNNLAISGSDIVQAFLFECPGATEFSGCNSSPGTQLFQNNTGGSPNTFHDVLTTPAASLGLSFQWIINFTGHDSVTLNSIQFGFETQSTVPEPSTFVLIACALLAIYLRLRALARAGAMTDWRSPRDQAS